MDSDGSEPESPKVLDSRFSTVSRVINARGGEYKKGDAYASEFRQRVVQKYYMMVEKQNGNAHGCKVAVAKKFSIDESTVRRYILAYEKEHGILDPLAKGGPYTKILPEKGVVYLERLLKECPTLYLWEMQRALAEDLGINVSKKTICWGLRHDILLSHKNVTRIAAERLTKTNLEKRALYWLELFDCPPDRILFLDETGVNCTAGYRTCGWGQAFGDTRIQDIVPHRRDRNKSIIAMISIDGLQHSHINEGSTNGERFKNFVLSEEATELYASGQYEILVMDNAPIHHAIDVEMEEHLDPFGVKVVYLPPYSPDLNPIEEFFSKFKHLLANAREGLYEDPFLVISEALCGVTAQDCRGYYRLYTGL